MDKQTATLTGGLQARETQSMGRKPSLRPSFSLVENAEFISTAADMKGDPQASANMRNWMECVRSRKTPDAFIDAGYSHLIVCERRRHRD